MVGGTTHWLQARKWSNPRANDVRTAAAVSQKIGRVQVFVGIWRCARSLILKLKKSSKTPSGIPSCAAVHRRVGVREIAVSFSGTACLRRIAEMRDETTPNGRGIRGHDTCHVPLSHCFLLLSPCFFLDRLRECDYLNSGDFEEAHPQGVSAPRSCSDRRDRSPMDLPASPPSGGRTLAQ
jgi:hypothetical protein